MKTTEEYFQEFYNEVRYQIEQGAKANFTRANKIWAKYEASQSVQADELTTLRAQLAEAKKYPELRCNHCDKVLTATWIDDDLGRFALIDKCYCG